MAHRHKQCCGDGQREGGWGLGRDGRRVEGAGNGDTCNSANNKNKVRKKPVSINSHSPLPFSNF